MAPVMIMQYPNNKYNEIPHLNYIYYWGIAESLQEPLLLSSINVDDTEKIIKTKLDYVSRFIETYTVRRSINYKKFGQTAIRYTMFNIIKQIRNNEIKVLSSNLKQQIAEITEKWDGILKFGLHGMNRKFVKHLLARISSYVDNISEGLDGDKTSYATYHHPKGRQYEIEHIWANKFLEHKDEFDQENIFQTWRNMIGALLLLPQGTNQSFNSDKYEDKLEHYIKENSYAKSLHPLFYEKNPNFVKSDSVKTIGFKPHTSFKKEDIVERQKLVKNICEHLWSSDYYKS